MEDAMNISDTHTYAKWLLSTRRDKAELHAANEQKKAEENGDHVQADQWRKIRLSIMEMRGSNVS
jgi:hypothetical protein